MTIGTTTSSVTLEGNGATTTFVYTFLIPNTSNAVVIYTNTSGAQTVLLSTQYTITGIGNPTGGTVTYPLTGGPIPTGSTLTVERVLPLIQSTSVSNQGPTFASIEGALDYLTMEIQQIDGLAARAIVVNPADPVGPNPLPVAAVRANNYLYFDSNGSPTVANNISGGVAVSAAMVPIVGASTLAQAFALLGGAPAYATITALRASAVSPPSPLVSVAGYYSAADGGGGVYAYIASDSTSADNGGTIIVDAANNRWYLDQPGNAISVKTFGAKMDGATDDTTAINAAETWLHGIGGGYLLFPAGTTITTGLTKLAYTIWSGAGIGATIIKLKANTTANAVVAGQNAYSLFGTGSLSGIQGWGLQNLSINGNVSGSGLADGVGVYGWAFFLTNVEIYGSSGYGLRTGYGTPGLVQYGSGTLASLNGCYIHDNNTAGVRWGGPSDPNFNGTWVYRNLNYNIWGSITGGDVGTGLKMVSCHTWGSTGGRQALVGMLLDGPGNLLSNCTSEGSLTHQVQLRNSTNVIVGGRYYYESVIPNAVYGITIGDSGLPSAANIIHTRIEDCQGGAIYFVNATGEDDIQVTGYNQSAGSFGYAGTPSPASRIRIEISGTFSVTNNSLCQETLATTVQIGTTAASFGPLLSVGSTGLSVKLGVLGYTNGTANGSVWQPSADNSTPLVFLNAAASVVGSIGCSNIATLYATSSDYRLKDVHGDSDGSLISHIKVHKAAFKSAPANVYSMVLAHELQAVAPHAVLGEKDAVDEHGKMLPQMVDHSVLVPELIAYCQALEARLAALENKK